MQDYGVLFAQANAIDPEAVSYGKMDETFPKPNMSFVESNLGIYLPKDYVKFYEEYWIDRFCDAQLNSVYADYEDVQDVHFDQDIYTASVYARKHGIIGAKEILLADNTFNETYVVDATSPQDNASVFLISPDQTKSLIATSYYDFLSYYIDTFFEI